MKPALTYLRSVFWLFLLVIISNSACSGKQPARRGNSAQQDTLITMVEKKIAEKKALSEFRERYLSPHILDKIERYYPIIRKYSKRYGLDWRLIVAQILKESRFKEDARSNVGAIGLMQIMPYTAVEIRREQDIDYIARDPQENIAAGIYHMYKQLKYFPEADRVNRIKLALAAYNAGPGRIFDAQDIARFLGLNPNTWEAVKFCLPKLTSKDWKLHLEVWELGVPTYGYFYGYEQTIAYVDDIWSSYQVLKKML